MKKVDYLLELQDLKVSFDFTDSYYNKRASYFEKCDVNSELESAFDLAKYKCGGKNIYYYDFLNALSEIPYCRDISSNNKRIIEEGKKKYKALCEEEEMG